MLEIQNHAYPASCNSQVIENLADMLVRDGFNRFDFHNDPPFNLQVGNIVVNVLTAIMNGMSMLGIKGDILPPELQAQGPFICFLTQSVAQFIQDRHGASSDLVHEIALNPFLTICVHSHPFAVVSSVGC